MGDLNEFENASYSSHVEDQLQLLRKEDPTQYNTLVKMHLSFTTDLPTVCDTPDGQRPAGSGGWRQLAPLARWLSGGKKSLPADETAGVVQLSPELLQHFIVVIKFLASSEHVTTEGIFRKCGSSSRQLELRAELGKSFAAMTKDNTNMPQLLPVLSAYSTHDVASLLKSMLAELPEPLLLDHNFILHCKLADASDEDSSIGTPHYHRRIKALQLLLLLLPACNLQLLRALLLLLHNIANHHHLNRMSACNLGMVFAPHIMCPRKMSGSDLQTHSSVAGNAVSFMVRHAPKLFQVPVELECDVKQYWINRAEAAAMHHSLCQQHNHNNASLTEPCTEHDPTLAHTVFSFVDREQTEAASARETTALALAELYAHVSNLPDSDKKKRLVRQFNTASGCGTPKYQHSSRAKAFAHSIKKHLMRGASRRDPSIGSCDSSSRPRSWQHSDIGHSSSKKSGSYSPRQALECSQMSNARFSCTPNVTSIAMNGPHSITTPNLCCTPKPVHHSQQTRAKSWDNLTTPKNLRKCLFPSSPYSSLKGNGSKALAKFGIVEKPEPSSGNAGTPSNMKCDGKCFISTKEKHLDAVRECERGIGNRHANSPCMISEKQISCKNKHANSPTVHDVTGVKSGTEKTPSRRLNSGYVNNGYTNDDQHGDSESRSDDKGVDEPSKNSELPSEDSTNPFECRRLSVLKQDVGCSIETQDGIATILCDDDDHVTTISSSCIKICEKPITSERQPSTPAVSDSSCTISESLPTAAASHSVVVDGASSSLCDGNPTTSSSGADGSPIFGSVIDADSAGLETSLNKQNLSSETPKNMVTSTVTTFNDVSDGNTLISSNHRLITDTHKLESDSHLSTDDHTLTSVEAVELQRTSPTSESPDTTVNTPEPCSSKSALLAAMSDSMSECPANSGGICNSHAAANSPCSPLTNAMLSNDITQALVLTPRSRCPIVSSKNSCSTLAARALHNRSARRSAYLPTVAGSPPPPEEVMASIPAQAPMLAPEHGPVGVPAQVTSSSEVSDELAECSRSEKKLKSFDCDPATFKDDRVEKTVSKEDHLHKSEMKDKLSENSKMLGGAFHGKISIQDRANKCEKIENVDGSSRASVSSSDIISARPTMVDISKSKLMKNSSVAAIFPKSPGMEDINSVSFRPSIDDSPRKDALTSTESLKMTENEQRGRSLVRRKSSFKRKIKNDSWKLDGCQRKEQRPKVDDFKNGTKFGKSVKRSLSRRLSRRRRPSFNTHTSTEIDNEEGKSITEVHHDSSPLVNASERVQTLPYNWSKVESFTPDVVATRSRTDRSFKSPSLSPFSCSPASSPSDPRYSSSTSAALGQFFRHLSSSSLAQIAQRLKTNNDPTLAPNHRALTPIQSDTSNSSFVSVPSSPVAGMDESLSLVFREYLETRSILTSANASQVDCQAIASPCNHRPASCCDQHSYVEEERESKCRGVPVLESSLLFESNTRNEASVTCVDGNSEAGSQSCDAINILYSFAHSRESSVGLSLPSQHSRYSSVDSEDPTFFNPTVSIGSESLSEFNEIKHGLEEKIADFSSTTSHFSETSHQTCVVSANEQTALDQSSERAKDVSDCTFHSTGGEFSNSLLQCLDGQNPLSVSCEDSSCTTSSPSTNLNAISSPAKLRTNFMKCPAHSRLSYRSAVDLGSLLMTDHFRILTPVCEQTSPPKSPEGDRGKENVEPSCSSAISVNAEERSTFRDRSPLTTSNENHSQRYSPNSNNLQLVHNANEEYNDEDCTTDILETASISSKISGNSVTSHPRTCSPSQLSYPESSATESSCNPPHCSNIVKSSASLEIESQGSVNSSKELASCSPSSRSFSVLGTKQGTPKRASTAPSAATAVHFETEL